jgi:signal peptidase II
MKIKLVLWVIAIILIDQATKLLVKLNMELGQEIRVIGDFFKIHFTENPGAAFGVTLSNLFMGAISDATAKTLLSILSVILVFGIAYYLYQIRDYPTALPFWIALILGGAIGNVIDRLFYGVWFASINDYEGGFLHGRVVDMFYFDIYQGILPEWIPIWGGTYTALWPIFNVADTAISIGIIAILVFQKKLFLKEQNIPNENKILS